MKATFTAIILIVTVMCAVSCGNHRTTSCSSLTAVQPDSTTTIDSAIEEEDTVLHFRFLDFRHDGSKESFLREAGKSDIFIPQNSSKVVKFLGADWGLNIKTDSLERVSEITLLTSNTSRAIFEKACTELLPFLEEPKLIDDEEGKIRWDSYYCEAYFQHLHSDDKIGWIMIFNLNYPEYDNNYLLTNHKNAIKKFQEDVRSKNRERIASHFKFPFDIGYPLPDIKDKNDFIARYELLFDKFIEEEISCSNDWCSWHGVTCNSGHLLFGDVDSSGNLIATFIRLHPKAYYEVLEREIDIQRQSLHPSLHKFRRPIVVARSESCIFRVDEIVPGELRLAIWTQGKTMKDCPDYVNKDGFISQVGSSGCPDWLFVNGTDTVWVGYMNFDNKAAYYRLERYSGEHTMLDITATDFED